MALSPLAARVLERSAMKAETRIVPATAPAPSGGRFSFFTNLRVGAKIYLGFGIVCIAVALLGGISWWTVTGLGSQFRRYGEMAKDTLLVSQLEIDMVSLRLGVNRYFTKDTKENLEAVRKEFETIGHVIEESKKEIHKPDRAKLIAEIDGHEDEYLKAFNHIVELMEKRDKLVYDSMNPLGADTRKLLSAINEGAYKAGDYKSANYALVVQENFLLARLFANKFLDTNDEDEVGRVKKEFEELGQAMKSLDDSLESPERRRLLDKVEENAPKYLKTFEQVVETIHERNKIRDEVLAKLGKQIQNKAEAVKESAKADEDALEQTVTGEVKSSEIETLAIGFGGLLVSMLFAFIIARGITRPVNAMTGAMARLANKDWSVEVPAQGRKDEIGEMAKAVMVFKNNGIESERLAAEQEKEQLIKEQRAQAIVKMTDEFSASVGAVVQAVASAATQMQQSAQSLSATAEETNRQSTAVAAASEEASTNVQTVASAAEELSASIGEISRQVTQSSSIAAKAVEEVQKTNANVQGLADAAQKIGEVVNLINDIASQTNLLALNATIEAARAGEAGKGFAVVASEVKSLANQTAKATEQIGSQITGVQSATNDAVAAIQGIGKIISEISSIASTIAAAVEEQGAATKEIARNVQQAAAGTNEVSSNITGVTKAAGETGQSSGQVLQAAGELSKQAEQLRTDVSAFVDKIRAA
jgi:methyl-accepting chemotaxis protein